MATFVLFYIQAIYMSSTVRPYSDQEASKRVQVEEMFDNIAPSYDLLNRLMTAGIDVSWRKKAIKLLAPYQPKVVVDIATGCLLYTSPSPRDS